MNSAQHLPMKKSRQMESGFYLIRIHIERRFAKVKGAKISTYLFLMFCRALAVFSMLWIPYEGRRVTIIKIIS